MNDQDYLNKWLLDMAALIEKSESPDPQHYNHFLQNPEFALHLIELIEIMDESSPEGERSSFYSACIFALEICVAQLHSASENNNKLALKTLNQLMQRLADVITQGKHSLSFWLPILNAFYEVQLELSSELQHAYFELANREDLEIPEGVSHLNSIRELIEELSDLSVFDITEHFFAQSYAMPPDFFADLLVDLYGIEEGHEIALLMLLHPKQEVRELLVEMLDHLIEHLTLSPVALSRMQIIKNWYPPSYHDQFNRWIKMQRKKGVLFRPEQEVSWMRIKASEVDGTGAQGIFIHYKKKRKSRLCGLLFKQNFGIKDAWITPILSVEDVARYYNEAFDDSVMLRDVDCSYLLMLTHHFLQLSVENGHIPDLHLLEIQEELGLHFYPQRLDVSSLMEELAIQISPFTPKTIEDSLRRSKSWPKNRRFTESWYVESADIDKVVNRCCSFVDGVRVCRFNEAMDAVFTEELEKHRESWLFHFLWTALWLRARTRKNEKLWQDAFFLAHVIQEGSPLQSIPIMHEICYQSVVNSVETMQERRTHLNQEG